MLGMHVMYIKVYYYTLLQIRAPVDLPQEEH